MVIYCWVCHKSFHLAGIMKHANQHVYCYSRRKRHINYTDTRDFKALSDNKKSTFGKNSTKKGILNLPFRGNRVAISVAAERNRKGKD